MTIADIIASRTDAPLGDLLLDMFTAGYDAALGNAHAPADDARADLIALVSARHRCEVLALRDGAAVAVPDWLERLASERAVGE